MLKNNAFANNKVISGQESDSTANINVEKYINEYRMLDIRCGVLEEERANYMMNL